MTVELRPLGVKCNIRCRYCYQNPEREAGNTPRSYSLERMKEGIAKEGGPFTLFGGEPLLMPVDVLEDLWSWGFREYGANSLQTNGTLITDNHIKLFRKYNVFVSISIDGPDDLNGLRRSGGAERTRRATAQTVRAIERLCREGIPPGLIVTLHRLNAARDRLPVMHAWFRDLEGRGITSVRLHILEVESGPAGSDYALSTEENLEAFLSLAGLEASLTRLRFDVFAEMRSLLVGRDRRTACIWNACDPYTTPAVRGVEGDGGRSNCGRVNKEGIGFAKPGRVGFERYLALYHTPQEFGGCKGCRFFLMCKGQCPGTAIDGDWRNRSSDCEVWKGLYRHFEREAVEAGSLPLSIHPGRGRVEAAFLDSWARGRNSTIADTLDRLGQGQPEGPPARPGPVDS